MSELLSTVARHSSASNEHYTPAAIVEAARAALGGRIDLDPASCALANRTVRADRIFTEADDGFTRPWIGAVFLNPPGGKVVGVSNQKRWWFKLVNEFAAGRVSRAIFVGFSIEILQTTQVKPSGPLPLDFPLCFPSRRVAYMHETADGLEAGDSPPHASVIVCVASRADLETQVAFFEAFSPIGRVAGVR